VNRRSSALVLLLIFVIATIIATVIAGSRPASQPGIAPAILQGIGYVAAFVGGVLLVWPHRSVAADPGSETSHRRSGAVVLGALALLVLLDLFWLDAGEPDIGGGGVRLLGLVAIVVVTARLASASASSRGRRR
jgi:hypothetical protein